MHEHSALRKPATTYRGTGAKGISLTYTFSGNGARLRAWCEDATPTIAAIDGLRWKIWGFDPERGIGTSAYCFEDAASAAAFARGPLVAALRAYPAVRGVALSHAPIDTGLSARTGAADLLAGAGSAAAPGSRRDLEPRRHHLAVV
jgi:hypothetical protein